MGSYTVCVRSPPPSQRPAPQRSLRDHCYCWVFPSVRPRLQDRNISGPKRPRGNRKNRDTSVAHYNVAREPRRGIFVFSFPEDVSATKTFRRQHCVPLCRRNLLFLIRGPELPINWVDDILVWVQIHYLCIWYLGYNQYLVGYLGGSRYMGGVNWVPEKNLAERIQ